SMKQKPLKKRAFHALIGKKYLKNAAAVLLTAERDVDEAAPWVKGGRLVNLPLIFDLTPFLRLPGPQAAEQHFQLKADDVPRVLFLSRIHPKKGVDFLVEAMRVLKERQVNCRLLIGGPEEIGAYADSLKAAVRAYQLEDRVRFLGMVPA